MTKILRILLAAFLLLWLKCSWAYDANSAAGYWQTIDDNTQKPRSIVNIFEKDGKFFGRVMQVNYEPGEGPSDICNLCTDSRKDQKILGMIIITKMVQNPENHNVYEFGKILDPKNGKVYKSTMTLEDNGKSLDVRGYIGIPLIGRTQTWQRLPDDILKHLPKTAVIAKNTDDK